MMMMMTMICVRVLALHDVTFFIVNTHKIDGAYPLMATTGQTSMADLLRRHRVRWLRHEA